MSFAKTFWIAHVTVWISGMIIFNFLSDIINMANKPFIGMPLGMLFVIYNIIALLGVIQSSTKHKTNKVMRVIAIIISAYLFLVSVYVPVYFWGRPIIML